MVSTSSSPGRAVGWAADRAARVVLIGLGFLLALTTARNTDVWAHLASGRAVVGGAGPFGPGVLPFSWLADVAMYFVFSVLGGAGLVVGKAILVAATVAVMSGGASWRGLLGVLLAVLALGAWLPLNPVCLSYLFMALTVSALGRPSGGPGGWRDQLRSRWPLVAGYVVWANADPGCLLGVAVLAAHAVGRSVVRAVRGGAIDPGPWRLLVLVSVAIALSPLPWYAPSLAREFASWLPNADPSASPFRANFLPALRDRRFEGAVPGVTFWLLVGVSLLSFVGAAKPRPWERFPVWAGLLATAVADVRFAPFFLVAAGTITALNVGRLPTPCGPAVPDPGPPAAHTPVGGRSRLRPAAARGFLGLLATTVLLAAAWAGWLQPSPAERRNWTVEPDPSLVRAAEEVGRWYAAGAVGAGRKTVFFAREAEDVFAWFAPRAVTGDGPGERGAGGVARVRAAVLSPDRATAGPDGGDDLADPQVGCVVLSDPNRAPFETALHRLTAAPDRWKLAHLRGRVAVFVRADSGLAAVDLAARAFDPPTADRAPPGPTPAFQPPPHWSDPFLVPRAPRSVDRDEAVTYLLHEEATRDRRMVAGANQFLAVLAASAAAAPGHGPFGWAVDPRLSILAVAAGGVRPPSEGPPPIPFGRFAGFLVLTGVSADHYLAVRAGRRGVAATPRDPAAYAALGEAYLHLLSDPLDSSWGAAVHPLRRLRQVQAAAAFRHALDLDPTHPAAHLGLATVYLDEQFLDLAEAEFRAYERFSHAPAPAAADLGRAVEMGRRTTEANAANLSVPDRARLAARNGLAGLALDTLLKVDVAAFGAPGIGLELDLLLAIGRVQDARDWLAPEHRDLLGGTTYDWLQVQIAAAVGDYEGAAAVLQVQAGGPSPGAGTLPSAAEVRAVAAVIGKGLLKQKTVSGMAGALLTSVLGGVDAYARQVRAEYEMRTDAHVILAVLALEQGDIPACAAHLVSVRRLWEDVDGDDVRFQSPARTAARQVANLIRR